LVLAQKELFDAIEKQINKSDFDKYIKPLKFNEKASKTNLLVYNAKNELMAKYAQTRFGARLASIYEKSTGIKAQILITSKSRFSHVKKDDGLKPVSTILVDSYSFETFIVGESNKMAYTAARYVAEHPGMDYNPLFIYGPSGLGKTHLLQSIGNFCINNGKSVICVTSEQFMSDFTHNLRQNTIDEKFKPKYRNCDLLLIDDIQFLGGKPGIQEEFFHTYNALKEKKAHIVMVSDKAPKFLNGFEERLLSRFDSGVVADITPPELETKIAIIEQKSIDNNIKFSKEIIEYIAVNLGDNIREIEGVINSINMHAKLLRIEVTLDLVKSILINNKKESKETITIDDVVNVISKELNVKKSDLKSKARAKNIVNARRIAIYLSKELTNSSMPTIASYFGLKDHSAVSHSIKKVNEILTESEATNVRVNELKNKIKREKSE